MTVLTLNPDAGKVIAALGKFVGSGHLGCVNIDADGLAATDTFTLALVPIAKVGTFDTPPDGNLTADWAQLNTAIKTAKKNVTVTFTEDAVTVAGDSGTVTFPRWQGRYPDVRSLMPDEDEPGELGMFNFELLGRFGTLAKSLGLGPLELKPRGARNACRATVVWSPELRQPLGLVMPMRGA